MRRYFRGTAMMCSVLGVLAACGGEGSTAPGPPAATPAPTPSPSPSPSPSSSPTGATLVGAVPGQTIGGPLACSETAPLADASGHVTGIGPIAGVKIGNGIEIAFLAADTYATNVNGFGGSSFAPADKRISPNAAYDQFLKAPDDEFFVMRPSAIAGSRTFALLGLANGGPALCFFAAGLPAPSLPGGTGVDYGIVLDGIAQIGGQTYRLLPSAGTLVVDFAARTATLHLELKGRGNAFEDFTAQPLTDIATVDATMTFTSAGGIGLTSLSGTNGFSGTLTGHFVGNAANTSGTGGSGAALVFELRSASGDVIFGAMAGERNLI